HWLADAGYTVTAAGFAPPEQEGVRFVSAMPDDRCSFRERMGRGMRLFAGKHETVYWDLHKTAWQVLENERADLIVSNDLDTLPIAIRIGEKIDAPVVFDAH